jgi:hypothetical protein
LERPAHAGTPVADDNVLTRIHVQPARMERAAAGLSVGVAIFLFFSIRRILFFMGIWEYQTPTDFFFFRIDNGPPAHLEGCRERGQPSDL